MDRNHHLDTGQFLKMSQSERELEIQRYYMKKEIVKRYYIRKLKRKTSVTENQTDTQNGGILTEVQ